MTRNINLSKGVREIRGRFKLSEVERIHRLKKSLHKARTVRKRIKKGILPSKRVKKFVRGNINDVTGGFNSALINPKATTKGLNRIF